MGAVGASKGVGVAGFQLIVHGGEVTLGKHHVGVEDDEIFALGSLRSVIAALAGTGVLLGVVVQVEACGMALAHLLAGAHRTILHHNHLEVAQRLCDEALQQLVHLFGAVVHGDDDGVFHSWRVDGGGG